MKPHYLVKRKAVVHPTAENWWKTKTWKFNSTSNRKANEAKARNSKNDPKRSRTIPDRELQNQIEFWNQAQK